MSFAIFVSDTSVQLERGGDSVGSSKINRRANTTEYEIIRLKPGDEHIAAETVNLVKYEDMVSPNVAEEYLTQFLADDDNYLIIAIANGNVAGFVLAYRLARVDGARTMMYLHEIGVLSAYRRQRIGTALMEETKRICQEDGIIKMWLGTSESNTAAIALYEKTGGKRLGNDAAGFQWSFER